MDLKKFYNRYGSVIRFAACAGFIVIAGIIYVISSQPKGAGSDTFAQSAQADGSGADDNSDVSDSASDGADSGESGGSSSSSGSENKKDSVYVYVCGHVVAEGVVECAKDARIYEAIELAGGADEEADLTSLNLAAVVSDGERIYVPAAGESDSAGSGSTTALVNINRADEEELMTLPGIGSSRAADIISYRKTNGRFESTEDIMKVSGIKESAYNKIKDYICV